MTTIMYVSAILAVVIILTIIGVLSRYRRCKPNQVLVVYGKTGGEKKSAKLYHGGAAFVLPIIQSYDVLSMEPMQIDCKLTGALSSQNIRVDVPTTITVAISTNPEIMQNAAERLLGMDTESTENLITDIVYGQMRLIIAEMTIEKLNSDRDEFLDKARKNIDNELNKLGLYLLNINISDIRDEAGYIMNLGKEAESRALNEAQANIEEQEKLGAIKIAVQQKPTDLRLWWKQQNPILRSPSSTRWLISGKKLPENRLRHLSTLTSEISRYLTAVRTVPVISLTMLSRPSLRHWESLISFRLQIL